MTKPKITTNDDIIKSLPPERQAKIQAETLKILKEHGWGGARANSGRKTATGKVLKFTKRLSEDEVRFINYAREHHINYDDLMRM